MIKKIAILSGDGVGDEITTQSLKVLNAIGKKFHHDFLYQEGLIGAIAIDNSGKPLPDDTLSICIDSDAILFGAIGDPKYDQDPCSKIRPEKGLLNIRRVLNIFCNIRPIMTYDALLKRSPLNTERVKGIDFLVYRELIGGIYFGDKGIYEDKKAYDYCFYSIEEIQRIGHIAFKAAIARHKKLTLVDKANVLETSRLWRETIQTMAKDYSNVEVDFLFIDNAAMQILLHPKNFDVILTDNMFGDILSDEASVISGSIGLSPSASIGDKNALFEPIHGSYYQAARKNIANPLASILSVAMMLDYFKLEKEAQLVRKAVYNSINYRKSSFDISYFYPIGTEEVGDFIVQELS
ncbi:3-isopropylmalate dehydrogenase [Candidatus Uzinura diaspidicola str. ASNER]|uniref:3-isopropylmalate dehydrogenase n=1 Tax=Candidatus Uzinura diaspidicola str. ASNER TaxID=1133592 RepID=L7VK61_9FLAO|nr:3-isopropylmalate dehydrogenase [Candidatus Uzinura diaspidicola str. ASNER]